MTRIDVNDISLTPRYNAAIDAIRLPDGSIGCRSAAARAAGCVPVNIIGNNPVDPAALAYVFPAAGPRQRSRQEEQVASFNVSGDPFSLLGGDGYAMVPRDVDPATLRVVRFVGYAAGPRTRHGGNAAE